MPRRRELAIFAAFALATGAAAWTELFARPPDQPTVVVRRIVATPPPTPTPQPTPTRAPAPVPHAAPRQPVAVVPASPSEAYIVSTIFRVFGPVDGPGALRVADCESGDGPDVAPGPPYRIKQGARNGVHAGAFQLSRRYHAARAARLGFTWNQMYEIEPNAIVAHDLFTEKGRSWSPPNGWTCAWAA